MNRIPCPVRLTDLVSEVDAIPLVRMQDGSGSSHHGGPEGWIHGLSMARIGHHSYIHIGRAVETLRSQLGNPRVVQVMVNKLHAGSSLDAHKDGLPNNWRYHLPVITHPDVTWWDEQNGSVTMSAQQWYGPVPYCGVLHSVHNRSSVDRVHIIADFERVEHARR